LLFLYILLFSLLDISDLITCMVAIPFGCYESIS
jgi:hypothetical protein